MSARQVAVLDRLLEYGFSRGVDAVVLETGRRPRLRLGETERSVNGTRLTSAGIASLLTQVAPGPPPDGAEEETSWTFDYRLGDQVIRVDATKTGDDWLAVASKHGESADGNGGGPGKVADRDRQERSDERVEIRREEPEPSLIVAGERRPGEGPGLQALLQDMFDRGASDLHLSAGQVPCARVHGDLISLADYDPLTSDAIARMLARVAPKRNARALVERGDTDFGFKVPGAGRFRVNAFRDREGVGAVFRHIPEEIPSFERLGIPDSLRELSELPRGLVLVTGPAGSGKSTTLAALIDLINRTRAGHIITIEDPIEFVHRSQNCLVNQREVGVQTQSFKAALRAALREDPDVVLVGEMRDLETVSIALETAEAGRLVFGTLHTPTAASTVERIVDQFTGELQSQIRMMLAGSLQAVVSQRLLKRKAGGRVPAFEVLRGTPAVADLIREGKASEIPSAMQAAREQGMITLDDSLLELVKADVVEPGEACRKAQDRKGLMGKLREAGIELDPDESVAA